MNVTPEIARVASGATWTVAGTVSVQLLGVATTVLAARAVSPDAYGIVGMALVVVAFAGTLRDFGLGPAIASGRLVGEDACSSAHWIVTGLGALASALAFAGAPLVGAFFRTPVASDVLRVMSPVLLLSAATLVPQSRLQHAGRYRQLAALSLLNQVLVTGGVLVAIALKAGLWILVLPGVAASALMVPAYWAALGSPPRLVFQLARVAPFAREGMHLSASNVLNYFSRNADNAIIGRLNGERALGLYAFAYNFLIQPLGIFSHALVPVLLPAFARVTDRDLRSDATVRAITVLLRLGAPFLVGGAAVAHVLVPLVFGAHWETAVPLVRILMLVGALQIVGPVFGSLWLALGDSGFILRWYAVTAGLAVAFFAIGAYLGGPIGVALAYAVFTCGVVAAQYRISTRRFAMRLDGLPSSSARIVRDLGLMVLAVLTTDWLARSWGMSPLAHLASLVAMGIVVYVVVFRILAHDHLVMALSVMPRPVRKVGTVVLRARMPAKRSRHAP